MDWETFWSLHAALTELIADADDKRRLAKSEVEKLVQIERAQAFNIARTLLFQKREALRLVQGGVK